jgi:uncharacterized protein YdbL (DUF1318 family)
MQDTISCTTPVGRKLVVIKAWLTGRDEVAIQNAIQSKLDITMGMDGSGSGATAKGDMLTAGQDKALELLIVSVDGDTSDLVNKVLDMRAEDYRYVRDQINKVTNPSEATTAVKKSDGDVKPSPVDAAAPAVSTESSL